jgi:hypothetical protein
MIRVIYSEEPNFPPSDQHPDAQRYKIAEMWVDAIGAAPTEEEVAEFLESAK